MRVNEVVLRQTILDVFMNRTKFMMPAFANWLEMRIVGAPEMYPEHTFWQYLNDVRNGYEQRMKKVTQ